MNSCECRPDAAGGCRHWRLVRDEAELEAPMFVECRGCVWCKRTERFMLVAAVEPAPFDDMPDGTIRPTSSTIAFVTAGRCDAFSRGEKSVFRVAISKRRLYRMVDDGEASDETTTTKRRERVR